MVHKAQKGTNTEQKKLLEIYLLKYILILIQVNITVTTLMFKNGIISRKVCILLDVYYQIFFSYHLNVRPLNSQEQLLVVFTRFHWDKHYGF